MEFKWERIFSLEGLKAGDIIRMDPECNCNDYFEGYTLVVHHIIENEYKYCPVRIFFDKLVNIVNNELIYHEINFGFGSCILVSEEDLSDPVLEVQFHLEKLINLTEAVNKDEDIYKDEIDLLLDCVLN